MLVNIRDDKLQQVPFHHVAVPRPISSNNNEACFIGAFPKRVICLIISTMNLTLPRIKSSAANTRKDFREDRNRCTLSRYKASDLRQNHAER